MSRPTECISYSLNFNILTSDHVCSSETASARLRVNTFKDVYILLLHQPHCIDEPSRELIILDIIYYWVRMSALQKSVQMSCFTKILTLHHHNHIVSQPLGSINRWMGAGQDMQVLVICVHFFSCPGSSIPDLGQSLTD